MSGFKGNKEIADLRTDGARAGRGRNGDAKAAALQTRLTGDAKAAALQTRLTPASKTAKRVRIANGTSKPSRGTSEARDEQQSTETLSGLRAKGEGRTRRRRAGGAARSPVYRERPSSFRCCCERCHLTRGAVVHKHNRRVSVSVESK